MWASLSFGKATSFSLITGTLSLHSYRGSHDFSCHLCAPDCGHDDQAISRARVCRLHSDRWPMGPPSHVPRVRENLVLRQLSKSARDLTCSRHEASGDRVRRTGRALALLLPG